VAESRRILREILELWRSRGWTDSAGAAAIAAQSLASGDSARDAAQLVPLGFLAVNGVGRAEVAAALGQIPESTASNEVATSTLTILFTSAGPSDENALRLGAEYRDVEARIRATAGRDRITLATAQAARPKDLIDAINRHRPTILHLAGHGGPAGVVMEGDDGRAVDVTTEQITRLVGVAGPELRLVFFNSCDSAFQAQPAIAHIDAAIGMATSIGDDAARVFASQFYSSIAEGRSLQLAFDQARHQINLEGIPEDQTPQLYTRPTVQAGTLLLLPR
jgi:CHAT domain-containing protein